MPCRFRCLGPLLALLLLGRLVHAVEINGNVTIHGSVNTCLSTGNATDAYACNIVPAIRAYLTGTRYTFVANLPNTGPASINFNGLGAKIIKKTMAGATTDLDTGDILTNQSVDVVYDGTDMQCQTCTGNMGRPGVLNVKAFGATGNSADDQTTALQAAIAALPSTGGRLEFPCGTYNTSSPLTLANVINIVFASETISRSVSNVQCVNLNYTASTGSLLVFDNVSGFEFAGINATYSHASYADTLIKASAISIELYFHDCVLQGRSTSSKNATALINVNLTYDVTLERCFFQRAAVAIQGAGTAPGDFANAIKIVNNLFPGEIGTVMIKAGGTSWTIVQNTFEPRDGTGIAAAFDTTSMGVWGLYFAANWLGDGFSGIWFTVTGGILFGATIEGNWFSLDVGSGTCLATGGSKGVSIAGNYFACPVAMDVTNGINIDIGQNFVGGGSIERSGCPTGFSVLNDHTTLHVGGCAGQANAVLDVRNGTHATGIEFGHNNPAGYGSTLGSELVSGKSFLAFHAEGGTTNGTYRTRGFAGSILRGTQTGGLDIGTAAATNADNQTLTVTLTIDPEGRLVFTGVTFANLGTPANGAVVYCSNCTVAATCASGGTGALAKRLNNAWVCN